MKPSNFCPICNREFSSKNSLTQLKAHLKWCNKKFEFLKLYNLDNNLIQKEYEEMGSVLNFMKKFPFWSNFASYYKLFKELNIDYSLKKSLSKSIIKTQRENTHIERYGVAHNFLKNSPSRQKWEKNLFDTEGIKNVFQRESVKKKSNITILKKYSKELWLHASTVRGANIISRLNKQIFLILEEHNIKFEIEFKLKKENSYFAYDILLENKKIIEINGDYWHGNPKIYKPDDIILKGSSAEIKVSTKWEKDRIKINHAISNGYDMLIIWEYEMKTDINNVITKIKNYAGNKD